jgi:hypothetical protein
LVVFEFHGELAGRALDAKSAAVQGCLPSALAMAARNCSIASKMAKFLGATAKARSSLV